MFFFFSLNRRFVFGAPKGIGFGSDIGRRSSAVLFGAMNAVPYETKEHRKKASRMLARVRVRSREIHVPHKINNYNKIAYFCIIIETYH